VDAVPAARREVEATVAVPFDALEASFDPLRVIGREQDRGVEGLASDALDGGGAYVVAA
jgi:hypothetical protein